MKKLISLFLLVGMLSACGSAPPVPEDHYYRLPDVKTGKTQALANELSVKRFLADGLHTERSLLHSDASAPLQIKRYHYHHWIKSPPRMLQESIISALRQSGVAKTVINYDAAIRSEYTLRGKIRKFEQLKDGDNSAVLLDIELRLDNRSGKPVYMKDFNIEQKANSSSPHDLVQAFGVGLQEILDQFISDWQKLEQ